MLQRVFAKQICVSYQCDSMIKQKIIYQSSFNQIEDLLVPRKYVYVYTRALP